jgi:hypothetical protein
LIPGEKDPGFFKEFPNSSHPMSEALIGRKKVSEYLLGFFRGKTFAEGNDFWGSIVLIDPSARKDIIPPHKTALLMALKKKYLKPLLVFSSQ